MGNKFFLCRRCGNLVGVIHSAGVPLACCGEPMEMLKPNGAGAPGAEKHLPVICKEPGRVLVTVGETLHPMEEDHKIAWIYLQTEKGGQRKSLKPGETPRVAFLLEEDKPVAVFSYCDKHGLWEARLGAEK